jgi:hypothetical protein
MTATGFELLGELEEDLEEEEAVELELLFPRGKTLEMASTRCPADTQYTLIGFGRYSDDTWKLPEDQYQKLVRITQEIVAPVVPPAKPVSRIVVVGHADLDAGRERREPGFSQFISEKRAIAVYNRLCCRLVSKLKDGLPRLRAIDWMIVGRGARVLAVPSPRTEAERKCNRRVEIILKRSDPLPSNPFDQLTYNTSSDRIAAAADHGMALDYYHIALQGTSGKYDSPRLAAKKAREIAEKIPSFLAKRLQDLTLRQLACPTLGPTPSTPGFEVTPCWDPRDDLQYFKDALQGAASKFDTADEVIQKAMEAAEATFLGNFQMARNFAWKYAALPRPMDDDCEAGGRIPGAPANHVVCRTHGHILDMSNRTVIAHDPEEYKKRAAGIPTTGRLVQRHFSRRT